MSRRLLPRIRRYLATRFILWITTLLAWLPLALLHACGGVIGRLVVASDKSFRRRIEENLAQAAWPTSVRRVSSQLGKALLEITIAWRRSPDHIAGLVVDVDGWRHVEEARASGRGIIWVTPHLGSYDIGGRYISKRLPVLAMYRPPKLAWLEPLMNAGRERDTGAVARADLSGVRQMLRTLKEGGSVIVLPDQVPSGGDGVWAPFFGRPAYTMTLVPRLAQSAKAHVLMFYAERLRFGRGFRLHVSPLCGEFSDDKAADAAVVNANVERLIRSCPDQYLWSYNRYKTPAGADAPTDKRALTTGTASSINPEPR